MSDKHLDPGYRYKGERPVVLPEVPKPRGRKDTRRWCKGVVGRDHRPVLVEATSSWHQCGRTSFRGSWWCGHTVRCEACGKVLRRFGYGRSCPTGV